MQPRRETEAITNAVLDMLSCRFESVPIEVLLSHLQSYSRNRIIGQFHACASKHSLAFKNMKGYGAAGRSVDFCTSPIENICEPTNDDKILDLCYAFLHDPKKVPDLTYREKAHFTTAAFKIRKDCIDRLTTIGSECLKSLQFSCRPTIARVLKMIRLSMAMVEELLKENPSLKIIHYVRDPRGIINSRNRTKLLLYPNDLHKEAELLCVQMLENAKLFEKLKRRYPDALMQLKYEDLVMDTSKVTEQVLSFGNLKNTWDVKQWLKRSTHSHRDTGAFGTKRVNPKATAYKWKHQLPLDVISYIDEKCEAAYDIFGYDKVDPLTLEDEKEMYENQHDAFRFLKFKSNH